MKYITEKIILEGRGISDSLKNYPDFIYKNYLNNKYGLKTDIFIDNLKVKNLTFTFTKEESCIDTRLSKLFGDLLDYVIINIKVNDEKQMKIDISHELTHLIKFYNEKLSINENNDDKKILSAYNKTLKIKSSLITSIIVNKDFSKNLGEFTNYMYWCFDDELNSKISELYTHFKNSNIKNDQEMEKSFEESNVYYKLNKIQTFDVDNFINSFDTKQYEELISFFNDFVSCLNMQKIKLNFKLKDILTIDDLKNFLIHLKKYIEPKIYKHYRKIKGIKLEFKEDSKFESVEFELKYLKLFRNFDIDVNID